MATFHQVSLTEAEIKLILASINVQKSVFEGLLKEGKQPIDRIPSMEQFVATYGRIENKLKLYVTPKAS